MSFLFDHDLFYIQPQQLSLLFHINIHKAYELIKRLKKHDLIQEIENGKYLVLGYDKKRILSNPFFIATHLVTPSYVSYWSALNYYGFTEQVPQVTFCATTKQKKPIQLENYTFTYSTIKKEKLYGYTKKTENELQIFIAEPEKALIDSLDIMKNAGGITEAANCINQALDTINKEKLIEYAQQFPNKSMISRLGYLLEHNQVDATSLQPYKSTSYVLLNPKKKKTKQYNNRWHLIVNEVL